MRYGIKRVTVEEICQKANVSKMTFYKYFRNKIELYKCILNTWFEEFWKNADEICAMDLPFTEKLESIFKWKLILMEKMSTEFIEEFITINPDLCEFMEDYYRKNYNRLLDLVAEWQKDGVIRSEMRPELFIAALNKFQELFSDDNLNKIYSDHIKFIKELHNLLFYGALNQTIVKHK
jgi:AcrR family transcriptional regulator